MSVPVRYSAAANYAVVDCGLSNTLQQEEQYHQQQQQQQQELFCQFSYNINENSNINDLVEQQQLMQQRSSMSSSVSPLKALAAATSSLPANINVVITNTHNTHMNINMDHDQDQDQQQQQQQQLSSFNSSSSTMAAVVAAAQAAQAAQAAGVAGAATTSAAAAAAAGIGAGANGNDNAEMRTEWMRMSDEGRYGTPGAAGLEYQKYELEQQEEHHQQGEEEEHETPAHANDADQPMEPSLMDNENPTGSNNIDTTTNKNLEDKLNALTSDELYSILKEYDALQDKYHTVLLLPKESKREVTAGGRDGSAYVLRCLKMWYELPSDVLFNAMSLVDRFLDRMAVKPKHMACMSVASFHLAIKQLELKPIPAEDLVTISQCGCTAGDLERMAGVIANKLGVQMGVTPITSVSYLRIYYALFRNLAKEIGGQFFEFYQQLIKLEELENRLEILLCDVKTTVITPSILALVLICLHLDFHIKESYTRGSPELKLVFDYILFLQQYMRIPDRVFTCGFSIVSGILSHYNGQNKQPYKQRLVWKLSSRTLRVLRPTNRFSSDLPTIKEGISNAMDDGCRSRTESLSSEEEEDWPTSPIIPIFEQC